MPHDCNGVELAVGDKVTIELTVVQIYPGADFCAVTSGRELPGEQSVAVTCQAKQLQKVTATS